MGRLSNKKRAIHKGRRKMGRKKRKAARLRRLRKK